MKLLACPFCGGPPAPIAVRQFYPYGVFPDRELANGLYVCAHVFCHECGAVGSEAADKCWDMDEVNELITKACEKWNRRDQRHANLYQAGEAEGLNEWPQRAAPSSGERREQT